MGQNYKLIAAVLSCTLLFAGCAGTVEHDQGSGQSSSSASEFEGAASGSAEVSEGMALNAHFQREDGVLPEGIVVRVSVGGDSADYPLDENGDLRVSGLPKSGEITLTLLDQEGKKLAAIVLQVSIGQVIDASTDENGIGHVTLKESTQEAALDFTWKEEEGLVCSLRLSQSRQVNA